jgi:hypothetical protein
MAFTHFGEMFIERVIGVRDDGVELEFSLPKDATEGERLTKWQFPARVFEPRNGPLQLLNGPELEARHARCLAARSCQVGEAVEMIERLTANFRQLPNAYRDREGLGSVRLTNEWRGTAGDTYSGELKINPELIRQLRARSDVNLGEIEHKPSGEIEYKPVTLDAAIQKHAQETIFGTIAVIFDTDANGIVWRKRRMTRYEIIFPDGHSQMWLDDETYERDRMSGNP